MEKIKQNIMTKEGQGHDINITLFRHGKANYTQGVTTLFQAKDLAEEGRVRVRQQAEKLSSEISKDEQITIWSSPIGRTLETATIISDVLKEKGFKFRLIKSKDSDTNNPSDLDISKIIRPFFTLEEVRGLDITLFSALVDGTSYNLKDGSTIIFDKIKTNPNNMTFQDYYYKGGFKDLLKSGESLPEEVRDSLNSVEEESSVHYRFDRKLETLKGIKTKNKQRVIIVSHHATIKDHSSEPVSPGDYVTLN